MRYEVEQKHRLHSASVSDFQARLEARGAKLGESIRQSDQYFAHPSRDFSKTDEALRIRTVGDASFITYKGPKLDTAAKTRHELELPLHPNDSDGSQLREILRLLGFSAVAVVHKKRREFQLKHGSYDVVGAFDDVDGLGLFVELELMADETSLDQAQRAVSELAEELALGPSIRQSYLEMLINTP